MLNHDQDAVCRGGEKRAGASLPASVKISCLVGSSISETSQQERLEGIREVGLERDYRHEQSRARQQKRSMERRIQRG